MSRLRVLILTLALLAAPALGQAHYQPGVFPLDSLTNMPPLPGVYFSENMIYYTGQAQLDRTLLNGRLPVTLNLDANIFAANQIVMWQTGEKFLGADYGAMILLPLMQPSAGAQLDVGLVQARQVGGSKFGLGDALIVPLILGWHGQKYDALFSYGIWAPTGSYSTGAPLNVGRGFWTNQLQLGGAYYLDEERTWSLNAVGTYEADTSRSNGFYPGDYFSLDWGVRKKLDDQWTIGLTGYDTWQLNPASAGFGFNNQITNSAHAIGGEVSVTIPEADFLGITLKFSHEYDAYARFQGDVASLTFSVPIDMELPSAPPPAAKPAESKPEPVPAEPSSEVAPTSDAEVQLSEPANEPALELP